MDVVYNLELTCGVLKLQGSHTAGAGMHNRYIRTSRIVSPSPPGSEHSLEQLHHTRSARDKKLALVVLRGVSHDYAHASKVDLH